MQKRLVLSAFASMLCVLLNSEVATAQSDTQKLEVGAQFVLVRQADLGRFGSGAFGVPDRVDPGFGGRLTYNAHRSIAFDAEVNFFPRERDFLNVGRKIQGLFGVKAGVRKDKFGVFGKARPGFMHFSRIFRCTGDDISSCGDFGRTEAVLDLGGVAEIYTSPRTVIRFDVGDTIIYFRDTNHIVIFPEAPGGIIRFTERGRTAHNLQINVGVGFRF